MIVQLLPNDEISARAESDDEQTAMEHFANFHSDAARRLGPTAVLIHFARLSYCVKQNIPCPYHT